MRKAGASAGSTPSTKPRGRGRTAESDQHLTSHSDGAALEIVHVATLPHNPNSSLRPRATAIVERYANFAALGGVIPLPLINVAGTTVIILRMVKSLCALYGVPYEHGRARAMAVSLAAGAIPTTASAVTSSTLIFLIPGANLLGLAVSSVTASACARVVGHRFVEHFEKGETLVDFPVIDRR